MPATTRLISESLRAALRDKTQEAARAHEELAAVARQAMLCRALLDHNLRSVSNESTANLEERVWEARADLPGLERREAELTLNARQLDRELKAARQALAVALDAECADDLRGLVKVSAEGLRKAMQSMARIQERQNRRCEDPDAGRPFLDPVALVGLLPEPNTAATTWLAAMSAAGFEV